jgi:hypothetical protein
MSNQAEAAISVTPRNERGVVSVDEARFIDPDYRKLIDLDEFSVL